MHIADGIIDFRLCAATDLVTLAGLYYWGRKPGLDEIPRMGLTGAALFSVSLLHFPIAGTTVHLSLLGLAGILLGKRSFPVIFVILLFQALLFQHGGLIVIGLNTLNMGLGAMAAWMIWNVPRLPRMLKAASAGFVGIVIPALLMASAFEYSGYGRGVFYFMSVYLITAVVEAALSVFVVEFLFRTNPDILYPGSGGENAMTPSGEEKQ